MRALLSPKLSQNPGPGGWRQDGGAWASNQQLVGRKETSPEGRSSLKAVSPGALIRFIPSGDMGGACSNCFCHQGPFDENASRVAQW